MHVRACVRRAKLGSWSCAVFIPGSVTSRFSKAKSAIFGGQQASKKKQSNARNECMRKHVGASGHIVLCLDLRFDAVNNNTKVGRDEARETEERVLACVPVKDTKNSNFIVI